MFQCQIRKPHAIIRISHVCRVDICIMKRRSTFYVCKYAGIICINLWNAVVYEYMTYILLTQVSSSYMYIYQYMLYNHDAMVVACCSKCTAWHWDRLETELPKSCKCFWIQSDTVRSRYLAAVSIKQHTRTPQNSPVIARYGSFVSSKFDQKLTHYGTGFNYIVILPT